MDPGAVSRSPAAGELWRITPVVLLFFAVNIVWVLRSDAAFEEEAAIEAEKARVAMTAHAEGTRASDGPALDPLSPLTDRPA